MAEYKRAILRNVGIAAFLFTIVIAGVFYSSSSVRISSNSGGAHSSHTSYSTSTIVSTSFYQIFSSSNSSSPPKTLTPVGVIAYVPVTVVNSEAASTPVPFQQQLSVNSSAYSSHEAANLQNVEFFTSSGDVIPSWLESGANSNATDTIYWLKLDSSIPENSSLTIYMGFAPKQINFFTKGTAGEAPSLSKNYGEYDSGALVFAYYTNFSGRSLPSSLHYTEQSNNECGILTNATYAVNNDLVINATGSLTGGCGGGTFFDTITKYSPSVVEADLVSQTGPSSVPTESYYPVAEWDTTFPSTYWGVDGGYAFDDRVCACGNQWQIMEGNPNALAGWAKTAPSTGAPPTGIYSLGWPATGHEYGWQNYREKLVSSNTTYTYQPSYAGFGFINGQPFAITAVFDWFRVRAFPPNGVTPLASFGSLVNLNGGS